MQTQSQTTKQFILNDFVKDEVVVEYIVDLFNDFCKKHKPQYVAYRLKPNKSSKKICVASLMKVNHSMKKNEGLIFVVARDDLTENAQNAVYSIASKIFTSDLLWNVGILGNYYYTMSTNIGNECLCQKYEDKHLENIIHAMTIKREEITEDFLTSVNEESECLVCMETKENLMVHCRHCTAFYCLDCAKSLYTKTLQENTVDKTKLMFDEYGAKAKSAKKTKGKNNNKKKKKQEKMFIPCTVCQDYTEMAIETLPKGKKKFYYFVRMNSKLWLKESALLYILKKYHDIDIRGDVTKPKFSRATLMRLIVMDIPASIMMLYLNNVQGTFFLFLQ